jgi:hypothetical protein
MADYATKNEVHRIVDKAVEDLSQVIQDMGNTIIEVLRKEINENTKAIIRLQATEDAILDVLIENKATKTKLLPR